MHRDLYPPIKPYNQFMMKVSELHEIYVEQCGNPKGKPIVFLHGGPGGGCTEDHRRYFDPEKYNITLFDQRGCGRSAPHAELTENTTWDLVSDIEKIRESLKIKKWHVFGGSWGSTLALAYAVTHPEKVSALILRGIFLCRPSEIHWFYQEGASQIFPDFWETYRDYIPVNERAHFVKAYYSRLTSPNETERLTAARIWSKWEAATSYLIVKPESIEEYDGAHKALAFARIECHYFMNNAFFKTDNFLIEEAHKLKNIPTIIVQGRYDIVCPARSAWEIHKAIPHSKLDIIADAGHAVSEPGIRTALLNATDEFAKI